MGFNTDSNFYPNGIGDQGTQLESTSYTGGFIKIAHDYINNPINPDSILISAGKFTTQASTSNDNQTIGTGSVFAAPTVLFTTTNDKVFAFGNNSSGIISNLNPVRDSG